MVYPKGAYFGHAYKAMVPFHLRRQQRLKKPRNVFHALKTLSHGVLWDLVRKKDIFFKELYFDTTTMEPDVFFSPSAFSNSYSFDSGTTASKSTRRSSSSSTSSLSENDKKEWKSSGFGFCVQEETTAPTQERETDEINEEDEISMKDEITGLAGSAKRPKKRVSELDSLYLAKHLQPDPEKRKLAWKGPPLPPKEYLTPEQIKRFQGLREYRKITKRNASKIKRAMREKAKAEKAIATETTATETTETKTTATETTEAKTTATETTETKTTATETTETKTTATEVTAPETTATETPATANEPCCSSSIARTKEKPSTSSDAKRESLIHRLAYVLHNFFASMPGKEYRRPSLKLKTQYVKEDEKKWLCPVCKKEESKYDPTDEMISCDKCRDWYHFSCVGIKGEYNEKRRWYCKRCLFKAVRSSKFDPGEYPLFEHK